MKVKSKALINFISELHNYIVRNPQFRKDTKNRQESVIQAEIRPLIIQYLDVQILSYSKARRRYEAMLS